MTSQNARDSHSDATEELSERELLNYVKAYPAFPTPGKDRDYSVITKLKQYDEEMVFKKLTDLLTSFLVNDDRIFVSNIFVLIVHLNKETGLEVLLTLLAHPDEAIRWFVCGMLSEYEGNQNVIEALTKIALNDLPIVKAQAVYVLGRVGGAMVIPTLTFIAENDPDFTIDDVSIRSIALGTIEEILSK